LGRRVGHADIQSDGKPKFAEGSTVAFRVRNYQNEELGFCISCDIFTACNMRTIKYVHGQQSPTDTPGVGQHWIYDARLAKKSDIRIASQPRVAKGEYVNGTPGSKNDGKVNMVITVQQPGVMESFENSASEQIV